MFDSLQKRPGTVFAAFVASLLSIVIIAGVVFLVSSSRKRPEDFLPDHGTLALFKSVSKETVRSLQVFFPLLRSIPAFEGHASIAIVSLLCEARSALHREPSSGCHETGWILFQTIALESAGNGALLGSFTVQASHPSALALLRKGEDRLARSKDFLLQTSIADPAFFLRGNVLPAKTPLEKALRTTLRESSIALERFGSGWTIAVSGLPPPVLSKVHTGIAVPLLSGSSLVLQFSNGQALWKKLEQWLPEEHALLFSSTAGMMLRSLLGNDVSLTYDILPLLKFESSLALQRTTSGTDLLLMGHTKEANLPRVFAALHTSLRSTLPSFTVTKHTFDPRFSPTILRDDDRQIVSTEQKILDWNVRETKHRKTGHHLATAEKNGDFIISNDATWLRSLLHTSARLPLPGSVPLLGGVMESGILPFREALSGERLLWSMEQKGGLLLIHSVPFAGSL